MVWHAACIGVLAGATLSLWELLQKCNDGLLWRSVGQLDGDDYEVDDTELHRYAFGFRNHDVYRNALSATRRRRRIVVAVTDVRLSVTIKRSGG